MTFLSEDFLLHSPMAKTLYHDFAKDMPIYDYHNHLPPDEIAENRKFENLSQIWLAGDHYKWRAMRTNGIDERYITGDASDKEKFDAWAATVPKTLRNPLYHWTHMELKKPFGITDLLNKDSAAEIYDKAGEMLQSDDFTTRGILKQMNVKVVCTTDDPIDDLRHHKAIAAEDINLKVFPAWRPDKAMMAGDTENFNAYVDQLSEVSGIDCDSFDNYMAAIQKRHDFFHEAGCRLSDHGLHEPYVDDYTKSEIEAIFKKVRGGTDLSEAEVRQFYSCMLYEFGVMDHAKGWVQQFHIGPIRNLNSRMKEKLGPDSGFDSFDDRPMGLALAQFLDRFDKENRLCKTIIYNLNSNLNDLYAAMIGNFQTGGVPGKMQFGSGWWFNDQKTGMIDQMNSLSNMGLLSHFVGMLTDSRSFLSFPRHDYFRRILCQILGEDVANGELPNDAELLGAMVQDICWNNALNYFDMAVD